MGSSPIVGSPNRLRSTAWVEPEKSIKHGSVSRAAKGADCKSAGNSLRRFESCSAHCFAHVAQLVEHTLGKGEVTGSIPVMGFGLIIGN